MRAYAIIGMSVEGSPYPVPGNVKIILRMSACVDFSYALTANMQDKVVDSQGNYIGKSTGRIYTRYYKKVISLGFIDPAFAEEGTEVTVIWDEPGERQVPVRAKVARFPYLDLVDNRNYDIESIASSSKRCTHRLGSFWKPIIPASIVCR